MKKTLRIALALIPALALSAAKEPETMPVYKTAGGAELKLHVFTPEGASQEPRACVVFFFGGGWVGGRPGQFYSYCDFLKNNGIVAISAEYRVKKVHGTTPFDCVEDGKSAIRWVREHAKELGIDPNRVVAAGGSAGGHVAACTGMIQGLDDPSENLKISSVPNAMVLFNPVADTTELGYGLEKVGEARKTEISPCHQVRAGQPPTLIFHGMADTTVPFENVERMTCLMKAVGNDCTLIAYEGRNHGFFCRGEYKKEDLPKIEAEMLEWMSKQNLL